MTAAFTIILPHKRNPGNDASLRICMDCLMANTANDFHLLMDAAVDEPLYPRVNRMIAQAQTDIVCYWASDFFAAPEWDIDMLANYTPDTIVTNVLVEPGVIGIHPNNVQRDFGRTPGSFNRAGFEAWCEGPDASDLNLINRGWYAPYMISRDEFVRARGFATGLAADTQGFSPADVQFFEDWEVAGKRITRARWSYTYHLQRYSEVDEQMRPERQ